MISSDSNNVMTIAGMKLAQEAPVKTTGLDPEAAKAAAKQFESMFLSQMMQQMMSSVKADPMFGGGKGEEMFKSVLVDEWAKKATAAGGIGLSDAVQRQLMKTQEV